MKFIILILATFAITTKIKAQEPLSMVVDVIPHNEWISSIICVDDDYFLNIRGICSLTPSIDHCFGVINVSNKGEQEYFHIFPDGRQNFALKETTIFNDTIYILSNDYLSDEVEWNIFLTNVLGDSLGFWEYSHFGGNTILYSIIVDSSSIFLHGYNKKENEYGKMFVLRLDKNGNIQKMDFLNRFTVINSNNIPSAIIQTSDGNFVITNRYQFYNPQTFHSDYLVGLCKFDRDFNIIWSQYLPPRGDHFYNIDAQVTETNDGELVLSTGLYVVDSISDKPDYYLKRGYWPVMMYKFDRNGNVEWVDTLYTYTIEGTYGAPRKRVNNLITARNGDVIGIGTYSHPLTKPYEWGWLFRYSPDGELLWEHYYEEKDNPGMTFFSDVVEDEKGNIIIVGKVENENQTGNYNGHGWLLRVDSMGCFEPGCHTDSLSKVITPVEEVSFASASRKILFFPNPANRDINVLIPDIWLDEKWFWEIYEINGRKVGEGALENNVHSRISGLETLESGLYFIRFYSGSGVSVTEKLVVE